MRFGINVKVERSWIKWIRYVKITKIACIWDYQKLENAYPVKKESKYWIYLCKDQKLIGVGEQQLADIQRIHSEFNDSCMKIRPITLEQAYEMAKNKETLIIDLRPADEFNSSHIENAINIPMKNLEENLKNLPQNKEIIVYCRGRNCAYANLASKLLNDNGFHAYSLNQSYYDWQKYDNF